MEDNTLREVALALREGDKARARRLLKPLLQEQPTADIWYLAAHSLDDKDQQIACLKRALKRDPWHSKSNRMLAKLESIDELEAVTLPEIPPEQPVEPLPELQRHTREQEFQRRHKRRRWRTRLGCLGSILLSMSCSLFTFSLIGMVPGAIGAVTQLLGGPAPVTEIDGVPIEDIEDAPAIMTPSQSSEASSQQVDVLDHGYLHEYTFEARSGQEVAIYVQFMSVNAADVNANVRILDPDDLIVPPETCPSLGEDGLLGGEGNVTFNCFINRTGTWKVRVLGINGESIGAYFVGVETLD